MRTQANSGVARVGRLTNRILSKYGLLVLLAVLFVIFSIALPNSFFTLFNVRTIVSENSIIVILAVAIMVPLASGAFDLSIGYQIGLAEILINGFIVKQHMPWVLAAVCVLVIGVGIGLINGFIVTRLQIDSFIATLGTGSVIYGLSLVYDNGLQIVGPLPKSFLRLGKLGPLGIPMPAFFALGVLIILWLVLEYLPLGRRFYVHGSNQRAAHLLGITSAKYVPLSFAIASFLCALGGILLGAQLRVGNPTLGPEYLLPAFSAAILGTTAIKPGRVNAWGTAIAVFLIAVGVSGLLQLGAQSYIQSLFNGGILLVAMAIAGITARRRILAASGAADDELQSDAPPTVSDHGRHPPDSAEVTTGPAQAQLAE